MIDHTTIDLALCALLALGCVVASLAAHLGWTA